MENTQTFEVKVVQQRLFLLVCKCRSILACSRRRCGHDHWSSRFCGHGSDSMLLVEMQVDAKKLEATGWVYLCYVDDGSKTVAVKTLVT